MRRSASGSPWAASSLCPGRTWSPRRRSACLFVGLLVGWLIGWGFEPSRPLGIISGLKTNSNPSLSYSAHKSFNTNHNICAAQLFHTYIHAQTHTHGTLTHTHIHTHIQNIHT